MLHRNDVVALSSRAPTASILALTAAMVFAGCSGSGQDVAPVSGRVTLDGQTMSGARLMFQPEAVGGSPSYGTTDQEGRYELSYRRGEKGAIVGTHSVKIEAGASAEGAKTRALPARYNSQTELRREIKSGQDNVIEFELTTAPD